MRKRSFHETATFQHNAGVNAEKLADFKTGDRVMTVDGFPGKVVAVNFGPIQGTETYQVELERAMGGGDYSSGQLRPIDSVTHTSAIVEAVETTASIPVEATTDHTANVDYPELEDILEKRLPNENIRVFASKIPTDPSEGLDEGNRANKEDPEDATDNGLGDEALDPQGVEDSAGTAQVGDVTPPSACSFCGHDSFSDPQMTGRGVRMRCDQCGGTMKSWGGQWEPEFPNSSQNKASQTWDYRSGGPGGIVQAPGSNYKTTSLIDAFSRREAVESLMSNAGILSWFYDKIYREMRKRDEDANAPEWWVPQLGENVPNLEGDAHYPHTGSVSDLDDPEYRFHHTAAWVDVQAKAARLRSEGAVTLVATSKTFVSGEVKGDNATYETQLNYVPGSRKVADWACGCKWAAYAWGRSSKYRRFEGRLCSHALATQYEASSRGIFGRDVQPDTKRPAWQDAAHPIVVQHQRGVGDLTRSTASLTFTSAALDSDGIYPDPDALDLAHPPIYASVQTLVENDSPLSTIISMVASCGVQSSVGKSMVVEALVSAERDAGRSVSASRPDSPAELISEAFTSNADRKHKHVQHDRYVRPYGWGLGWCALCGGAGCGNCNQTGQVPQSDPTAVGPGGAVDAGGDGGGGMDATAAMAAPCETPGAQYSTNISGDTAEISVKLPFDLPVHSEDEAKHLEVHMHNAMEDILAPYFVHTADHSAGDPLNYGNDGSYHPTVNHSNSQNPASTGWATSQDPGDWGRSLISNNFGLTLDANLKVTGSTSEPPTVSGVALKAGDTGRVLMIQRSVKDDKDPARGTWEFPGGHHEPGDQTSLHAGIREWEEEVGQKFPEGGHLTHVHRSGPYVLHVVHVPDESGVNFHDGRSTVNPDDPDGDDHEQSAWWDPEHAKKNPALRSELKSGPWNEIKKAAALGEASEAALDFESHLMDATLHDEPEPALPATDGANDTEAAVDDECGEDEPESESAKIIAAFHRTAGGSALKKESMKDFSFAEQQELINEGKGDRARNFGDLKIAGTHYEQIESSDVGDDETVWWL